MVNRYSDADHDLGKVRGNEYRALMTALLHQASFSKSNYKLRSNGVHVCTLPKVGKTVSMCRSGLSSSHQKSAMPTCTSVYAYSHNTPTSHAYTSRSNCRRLPRSAKCRHRIIFVDGVTNEWKTLIKLSRSWMKPPFEKKLITYWQHLTSHFLRTTVRSCYLHQPSSARK